MCVTQEEGETSSDVVFSSLYAYNAYVCIHVRLQQLQQKCVRLQLLQQKRRKRRVEVSCRFFLMYDCNSCNRNACDLQLLRCNKKRSKRRVRRLLTGCSEYFFALISFFYKVRPRLPTALKQKKQIFRHMGKKGTRTIKCRSFFFLMRP
jgi:hypothetical protein